MNQKGSLDNDIINLSKVLKLFWEGRLIIVLVSLVFIVFGSIYIIFTPNQYESKSVLLLEGSKDSQLGGALGSLASLTGVNLNSLSDNEGAISPNLFPKIVESTPFLLDLMNESFYFTKYNKEITIEEYYLNYRKKGIVSKIASIQSVPSRIVGFFRKKKEQIEIVEDKKIQRLSEEQIAITSDIKENLELELNEFDGTLTIRVNFQDPRIAALISDYVSVYITKFVTDYKSTKSSENITFISKQLEIAEEEFLVSQRKLAKFRDQNINIISQRYQSQVELLESEFNIKFNKFNLLTQELEKSKIALENNKPIFKLLQPPIIPIQEVWPSKKLILIVSAVFGTILGSIYILIGEKIRELIRYIKG